MSCTLQDDGEKEETVRENEDKKEGQVDKDSGPEPSGVQDKTAAGVKEEGDSSDDQFENTAEEILEAERGVAHTWTDDSEACVTDQEENRSEVKKAHQVKEVREKIEESGMEEVEAGEDEADGEPRHGDQSQNEEFENGVYRGVPKGVYSKTRL